MICGQAPASLWGAGRLLTPSTRNSLSAIPAHRLGALAPLRAAVRMFTPSTRISLPDIRAQRLGVPMPSGTLDEPLLTASQVSELLGGIPTKTILQYARDGRLPCLRIGKHVRFIRSEIGHVLDAQRDPRRRASRR